MTIDEAIDAICRDETPEQYKKRLAKIRRLTNERDYLEDAIEVLEGDPRQEKKIKRLAKVKAMIAELI